MKYLICFILIFNFSIFNAFTQKSDGEIIELNIKGMISNSESEVSGMAWFNDNLILLPQYPERSGGIYRIPKKEILKYLSDLGNGKDPKDLKAMPMYFMSQYWDILEGYEGYEAIVIESNSGRAWLTIEFEPKGERAFSIVVEGKLDFSMNSFVINPIDAETFNSRKITSQSGVENMAEESLILIPQQHLSKYKIFSIHEANGVEGRNEISATLISNNLENICQSQMPIIPFRITDATELDANGKFWIVNYYYPKDKDLKVSKDEVLDKYKLKPNKTHKKREFVERLIELEYANDKINFSSSFPIQLKLDKNPRNWEGIVRLDDMGFLLITDKFPETLLGFVKK